jgi:hypothetical protein
VLLALCIQIECTYSSSYVAVVTNAPGCVERIYYTILTFVLVFFLKMFESSDYFK